MMCFCATFQGLYIKAQYTLSNRLVTSTVLVFSPSCNFYSNLNTTTLLNYQGRLRFVWAPRKNVLLTIAGPAGQVTHPGEEFEARLLRDCA